MQARLDVPACSTEPLFNRKAPIVKILFLTTRLFGQPTSGGEICTARLLGALRAQGHALTLVGRGDAAQAAAWASHAVSVGPIEQPFDAQTRWRRMRAVAGALLSGQSITTFRLGGQSVATSLKPYLQECDTVIADHLQVTPWLNGNWSKPVMLVQHNVESDNYLRRGRAANKGYQGRKRVRLLTRFLMRREAQRLLALELQALDGAEMVACLTEADAARMAEIAARCGRTPKARLRVLPGYPLTGPVGRGGQFVEPASVQGEPHVPAIGLIGTWSWAPNREALQWLLDRVWPQLQGRARLVLAGSGLDGLAVPPNTRMLGRVDNVRDFLDAVDMIAIPSLNGSGIQEKALEAIATGLPVIATPHALRGLASGLPPNVRVARGAEGFAVACLEGVSTVQPQRSSWDDAVERWRTDRRAAYAEALRLCMAELNPRPSAA